MTGIDPITIPMTAQLLREIALSAPKAKAFLTGVSSGAFTGAARVALRARGIVASSSQIKLAAVHALRAVK